MMRCRRAEVFEEAEKRRFRVWFVAFSDMSVPAMISRDGENQSRVILIGFVKFGFVQPLLPVVVHNIAKDVEERGTRVGGGFAKLVFHSVGDGFLGSRTVHSTDVTDTVKNQFPR